MAAPQAGGVTSGARWPERKLTVEVGVGELGQAVEGGGQRAVAGVGDDLAGELDQDAALGRLGDQVDGDQGVEGVLGAGRGGGSSGWAR